MQWWNDFVGWFYSDAGERVMLGAVVPFVAIIVAALIAAAIARGSIKRLLRSHDRELKAAAVAGLVDAARQASTWNSLSPHEQAVTDRAAAAADIQLRLLPVQGAAVAANWAGHEIRQFKRASATYSIQFDGPLAEFRDRLLEWQQHPRRSRKIFESDLERWKSEASSEDRELQANQDAWVAQQHADRFRTAPASDAQKPLANASTPSSESAASAIPDIDEPAPTRPSIPIQTEGREAEQPGSVEAPTDDSYAPPVAATAALRRDDTAKEA